MESSSSHQPSLYRNQGRGMTRVFNMPLSANAAVILDIDIEEFMISVWIKMNTSKEKLWFGGGGL